MVSNKNNTAAKIAIILWKTLSSQAENRGMRRKETKNETNEEAFLAYYYYFCKQLIIYYFNHRNEQTC